MPDQEPEIPLRTYVADRLADLQQSSNRRFDEVDRRLTSLEKEALAVMTRGEFVRLIVALVGLAALAVSAIAIFRGF